MEASNANRPKLAAVVAESLAVVEPEEAVASWQIAVVAANKNHPKLVLAAAVEEVEMHFEALVVRFENNSAEAAVEEVETALSSLESSFRKSRPT